MIATPQMSIIFKDFEYTFEYQVYKRHTPP